MSALKVNYRLDGLELDIKNGEFENGDSLESALLISLFTPPFWAYKTGSGIPSILERGKIDDDTVSRIQAEAKTATAWLVTEGHAESVSVVATLKNKKMIFLEISAKIGNSTKNFIYNLNERGVS